MSESEINENKYEVAGFIKKTYQILQNSEFNKIIFWAPNGKEFVIKDISKFQEIVLPKFFRHRNINSFIRQLNMYGFHKGKKDSSKCIFSHPYFIKDKEQDSDKFRSSLHLIKRKFKSNQVSDQIKVESSVQQIKPQIVLKIATPSLPHVQLIEKPIIQRMVTPIKNTKYLISTRDLINTGPNISFLKLSNIEIHSKVSLDSDNDDCVSIEHEIERNNAFGFNNRIAGISLMNTINFLDEAILF